MGSRELSLDSHQVIEASERFTQDEEQQLVTKATSGDQQAFYQLYEMHHKRVYGLCWRMLADKSSAEDVCQEVFVQVWQKLDSFKGNSKFSTWLHSVTTNIVLSHLRKHKNWLQRVFSIEDQIVEEHGEQMQEISQLDKHILKLPERARLVFVLFAVEGYRHEEIGKMLNMAVGSSKAQYHRAKSLLKEWLEE